MSPAGTSSPLSRSTINSGRPPTRKAMGGTRSAMASMTAVPSPSDVAGCQSTSSPAIARWTSSTNPARIAASPPIVVIPAETPPSSTRRAVLRSASGSRRAISSSNPIPFSTVMAPTTPQITLSSGHPHSLRQLRGRSTTGTGTPECTTSTRSGATPPATRASRTACEIATNRATRAPYLSRPRGTSATRRVTTSGTSRRRRPTRAARAIACARASWACTRSARQNLMRCLTRRTARRSQSPAAPTAETASPAPRARRSSGESGGATTIGS